MDSLPTHRCKECTRLVCYSPDTTCEDCVQNQQSTAWDADAYHAPCYGNKCQVKFDNLTFYRGLDVIPVPDRKP